MVKAADYQSVLADLEAQRAELDRLIAGIKAVASGKGLPKGRLRQEGHEVLYVAELSPSVPDDEVLQHANADIHGKRPRVR